MDEETKKQFLTDVYYFHPDLMDELNQAVGDVIRNAVNDVAERRLHKEKGFISEDEKIGLLEPIIEKRLTSQSGTGE